VGKCPEPNDDNISGGMILAFVLNVGLRLIGETGFGLPLVNALSERFPDLSQSNIGDIASLVGEGVRAGTLLTGDEMGAPIDPGSLPIVPADFHVGSGGDRIVAGVDVSWENGSGGIEVRRVWVNALEIWTPNELLVEGERLFWEDLNDTDPREVERITELISHLIFLSTRY